MKITSGEQTALRCMMQLGKAGEKVLSVSEIASQEGLPEPFAAKILSKLRRAGLIKAVRGRTGGYILSKKPTEISAASILGAVAEPLFDRNTCIRSNAGCVRLNDCTLRPVWERINGQMQNVLATISLEDLLGTEREMAEKMDKITSSQATTE